MSNPSYADLRRRQSLPADLKADSIYFIAEDGATEGELYVTNNTAPIVATRCGNGTVGALTGFRGDYSAAASYVFGEIVRNQDAVWFNKTGSQGIAPPTRPTISNDTWEFLIETGVSGSNGIDGQDGVDGLDGQDGQDGASLIDKIGTVTLSKSPESLSQAKATYSRGFGFFAKDNEAGIFDTATPLNDETANLDTFFTFQRNTAKRALNKAGIFAEVAANTIALEHDMGAIRSISVTDNASSIHSHSTDPTQANVVRLTSSDSTTSIIEGQVPKNFTVDTDDNTHDLRFTHDWEANTEYLIEMISKSTGHDAALLLLGDDVFKSGFMASRLNFNNGAIYGRDPEVDKFGVKKLEDGYNYSWLTATTAGSAVVGANTIIRMLDRIHTGSTATFVGDGVSGFELPYFNIRKVGRPFPIIVTGATPSAADVADDRIEKDTPADFFKNSPLSIEIDISGMFVTSNNPRIYYMDNGTDNVQIRASSGTKKIEAVLNVGGTNYTATSKRILSEEVLNRLLVEVERDVFGFPQMLFYINGELQDTVSIPNINFDGVCKHRFGRSNGGNNMITGGIERGVILAGKPERPTKSISVIGGIGPSLMNEDVYGLAEEEFFVDIVARAIGRHVKAYNFAVSGTNTMEGLIDQLPSLLAVKPDIALIGTGNFETGRLDGIGTINSITLSAGDDETVFRVGAWIDVDVRALGSSDAVINTRKIASIVGKVITVTEDFAAIPQDGAAVFEGVAANIADAADQLDAIGALVIVCGFPYQNVNTLPQRDTVIAEGSRADERQRARDGVALSKNAIYSDHYAIFGELITSGFATQDDGLGHIANDNFHHTQYGQYWQRAYPTIQTLRSLNLPV